MIKNNFFNHVYLITSIFTTSTLQLYLNATLPRFVRVIL